MKKRAPVSLSEHENMFYRLARQNSHRHRIFDVFGDFCEMLAIEFSQAVDHTQREQRGARYAALQQKYDRSERERFAQMTACLVNALEFGMSDCLGTLFMGMDLGNAGTGQFFTPYEVSRLTAQMTLLGADELIARKGFITLSEPACGAGGMVVAAADTLRSMGVNYQECMHVTAVDIDRTACHMAYIQMSLLHIPGIVIHGNALAPQRPWEQWFTPAHVLGRWDGRLACARAVEAMRALLGNDPADHPGVEGMQPATTTGPDSPNRMAAKQIPLF